MQAMLKKAQKMQNDMIKSQNEINDKIFEGESSFVKVQMKAGNVISIKINSDSLEKDDIEMLEDIIVVAIKDAKSKYDKEMEEKMGAYTNGIPGMF